MDEPHEAPEGTPDDALPGDALPGDETDEVEELLHALRQGERQAYGRLIPLVYDDLRRLARIQLRRLRPGETLDTTALVHETYLKLGAQRRAAFNDRGHFLAVASLAMRHLLVNEAQRRTALRRGGGAVSLTIDEARVDGGPQGDDGAPGTGRDAGAVEVLALHEALERLSTLDERLGRLVELRFFGGLTVGETSEALGLSERTVKRDWRKARALLYRDLHSGA